MQEFTTAIIITDAYIKKKKKRKKKKKKWVNYIPPYGPISIDPEELDGQRSCSINFLVQLTVVNQRVMTQVEYL